jgi:hypothetical protein
MLKGTLPFIPLVLFWFVAAAPRSILSFDSYGLVVFGTRLSDVEKKLGEKAESDTREPACSYVTFKRYPNVAFMVENSVVTRADVGKHVPNAFVITVGTSLVDVKRKFPRVIVEPHQYDSGCQYDNDLHACFESRWKRSSKSSGPLLGI